VRYVSIFWERILGGGGEGTVYLGQFADGEWCAIKAPNAAVNGLIQRVPALRHIVRQQLEVEFQRHGQVVGNRHVRLLGANLDATIPFIALELAPEGTLGDEMRSVFQKNHVYHPRWALARTLEMLLALAEAHGSNLLHRDVKPENFLRFGPVLKLSDFGLGRTLWRPCDRQTRVLVGTPRYASPEQLRRGCIDGRSDLYSVGVILYEMLMGSKAVPDPNNRRFELPSKRFPNTGGWLEDFLTRLLSENPAVRPPTAWAAYAEAWRLWTAYETIQLRAAFSQH